MPRAHALRKLGRDLALARRKRGIATAVLDHKAFASREEFDAALMARIDAFSPTLVVLAGFMRILTAGFVEQDQRRLDALRA